MKELQLHALVLHGPFARSLDASGPEQQSLTSKLGHGAPIASFQTVGTGEACITVAMAPLSWSLKKDITKAHSRTGPSGELHRQPVQNSNSERAVLLGTNWMEGILSALLNLAWCVCSITDVFAVEILYVCPHCNLSRKLGNLQNFNTMYWQFCEALYGCQGF